LIQNIKIYVIHLIGPPIVFFQAPPLPTRAGENPHFEICFAIMGSFSPVSPNGYRGVYSVSIGEHVQVELRNGTSGKKSILLARKEC
jgi:hypothetical protein